MDLKEKAYTVDELGAPQLVVDDEALLNWAAANGVPPREAPLEALRNGIIPLRYLKNFWALNIDEQARICSSDVLICGCGGLGGSLINLLARAGVGRLRLIDGEVFYPSNLNRQLLSDTGSLLRSKAEVAAEVVHSINPLIEVEVHAELLTGDNAERLLAGANVVLDALDNLPTRFILSEAARRWQIPFIHAAVAGWWGQISTFLPQSDNSLKDIYGNRSAIHVEETSIGVLGPTASIIGSLEAMEALRILCGRPPAYADRLLYFEGESGRMEILPLGA